MFRIQVTPKPSLGFTVRQTLTSSLHKLWRYQSGKCRWWALTQPPVTPGHGIRLSSPLWLSGLRKLLGKPLVSPLVCCLLSKGPAPGPPVYLLLGLSLEWMVLQLKCTPSGSDHKAYCLLAGPVLAEKPFWLSLVEDGAAPGKKNTFLYLLSPGSVVFTRHQLGVCFLVNFWAL